MSFLYKKNYYENNISEYNYLLNKLEEKNQNGGINVKKIIFILALVVVATFCIACSNNDKETARNDNVESTDVIEEEKVDENVTDDANRTDATVEPTDNNDGIVEDAAEDVVDTADDIVEDVTDNTVDDDGRTNNSVTNEATKKP